MLLISNKRKRLRHNVILQKLRILLWSIRNLGIGVLDPLTIVSIRGVPKHLLLLLVHYLLLLLLEH